MCCKFLMRCSPHQTQPPCYSYSELGSSGDIFENEQLFVVDCSHLPCSPRHSIPLLYTCIAQMFSLRSHRKASCHWQYLRHGNFMSQGRNWRWPIVRCACSDTDQLYSTVSTLQNSGILVTIRNPDPVYGNAI